MSNPWSWILPSHANVANQITLFEQKWFCFPDLAPCAYRIENDRHVGPGYHIQSQQTKRPKALFPKNSQHVPHCSSSKQRSNSMGTRDSRVRLDEDSISHFTHFAHYWVFNARRILIEKARTQDNDSQSPSKDIIKTWLSFLAGSSYENKSMLLLWNTWHQIWVLTWTGEPCAIAYPSERISRWLTMHKDPSLQMSWQMNT